MRRLVIQARVWLVRAAFALAGALPLQPYVVLATSLSRIGGNLAAIHDELRTRHGGRVVTLVHDARPGPRGRLRAAIHALEAGYHLARARVFVVDSHYVPVYVIRPRPGTTIAQTWHASGAIKRIGYSVVGKDFGADETLVSVVRLHANYTLCLAASRAAALQFVDAFHQPISLFRTDLGIPKTDVLFGERAVRAAQAARERYAIPDGRRVILYAPTFRGETMIAARHPEGLDLKALARRLGEDHVLLLRSHPAVRARPPLDAALASFVIDVSDHPEVNELLLVTDVLVSDYSSVIFDFALLGRPMAFFAPDHEHYERERGFYFDYLSGVPGPVFETTEDLAAYLRAGPFDTERVRRFAAEWFEVADGLAAERFVERVIVPALDEPRRMDAALD
jgi:CDP-ribitol ribitolphosphotransferase